MYWIAVAVSIGFAVLFCLGRKEDVDGNASFLLRPFYKIAMYLYKRSCSRLPELFSAPQVEQDLKQLYPGEARECLRTAYYVKKGAISLAIMLSGTWFAAAVRYSVLSGRIVGEEGEVLRGEYREEARDIELLADYGDKELAFRLQVEPVLLTGEQREALLEEFLRELPGYILGKNGDLQNVTHDLALEERYGDYPVCVEWESDRPDIISDTGNVAVVEQAEEAVLRAHLSYGGVLRTEEITVTVGPPPLTEEELLYKEMEEMLQEAQRASLEQAEWRLPSEWRGESIGWRQAAEDNSLLLWAGAMAAAAASYLISDKDLHKQLEKRKECIHREYPEIVHKLRLFLGAGMTVRGAFRKIAGDYEERYKSGSRASPAYEEMLYACHEQYSGVSEGASYEHFGKRIGLQEYIRLSTLLMQNLKRGNSALLERLREEADKAAQEQLQRGKRLGEEAGTKLLVPMILMLAVVMAVIMIPAFSNM